MIDVMINIDCRDGMKSIPDKSIDMVCTDLPYGITRNKSITPPKSPTIGEACKEAMNSVPC